MPIEPGHDREVVGGDRDEPPVDLAVAGDDAVGRRLLALQAAHGVVDAGVDAELGERARVDQQLDALARGQLARSCWRAIFSSPPPSRARRAALVRGPRRAGAGSRAAWSSWLMHGLQRSGGSSERREQRGERGASSGAANAVISQADDGRGRGDARPAACAGPSSLRPPGRGERGAGSTAGSSTSRSRWTKTSRPPSSVGELRRRSTRPTPCVSSSTRSPASRSRTPHMTTLRRVERRPPRPVSQTPHAPARHMPPRKPRRRRVGRVEVAVRVEPQDAARPGRSRTSAGQRRHADRAVRGEQHREARRRAARRRAGRRPRAGSRASRAGRPPSGRRAARRASRRCAASTPSRSRELAAPSASAPRRAVRQSRSRRPAAQPTTPVRARSSARPPRLALLEERLDALLDVLGRERDRQLRAQEVERVVEAPCPAGGTSRPCPAASAPATSPPAARAQSATAASNSSAGHDPVDDARSARPRARRSARRAAAARSSSCAATLR